MRRELAKGDLPALVLAVLGKGPRHGYAIAREVERLSDGALHLREGTLYPALRVLEQDGLIVGAWESQAKGADRKVYALTEPGHREMGHRTQALRDYATLLHTVLGKIGQGAAEQGKIGQGETGYAQPA
jgi:PadR family transcriptional regulator PadR